MSDTIRFNHRCPACGTVHEMATSLHKQRTVVAPGKTGFCADCFSFFKILADGSFQILSETEIQANPTFKQIRLNAFYARAIQRAAKN